ncbi:MAG TPA: antitoxin [Thermoplasmata archaeon]|nr:antitoxin [Thermoplasmata archaeon]
MVQSLVTLSEDTNRVLNVVKAKHGLRTKSEAIELVARAYAEELLEPELRPEYVETLEKIKRERSIPVRNFAKRYGLR